jgi:phosphoglycerate kinase
MELFNFQDAQVAGARVLVRVDFNVPIKDGVVKDDTRIRASLPTIMELHKMKAKIILCSHLGRPDGVRNDKYSLKPIAAVLQELLTLALEEQEPVSVNFVDDCIGYKVMNAVNNLEPGCVLLMENTRFYREEERNQQLFSIALSQLCDVFVNDAFGSCHRAHSSTEGVAHYRPSYAGLLVQKEVDALTKVITAPERPYYVVLGGAKISGKIEVLTKMIDIADAVFIGGAMAFTFARAMGYETGKSLVEEDKIMTARELLAKAHTSGKPLNIPEDVVVTDDLQTAGMAMVASIKELSAAEIGADIGPKTSELFAEELKKAKLIFWNGPMGVFENERFAAGTIAIANALAESGATTVVGGGETVMAVNKAGVSDKITHVSTGGGASLEFIEGKTLPGIAILEVGNKLNPAHKK